MKSLSLRELEDFLKSLDSKYTVKAPVTLHDGTRVLGSPEEGPLAIHGGHVSEKPTAVFFPQFDQVLRSEGGKVEVQKPVEKPLFVFGYTAQDAECLKFVDKFFTTNYQDDIYLNKRNGAVIAVVSGKCGQDGEFLKIAGGDCDIEFVCDGEKFIAVPYTDSGKAIAEQMPGSEDGASLEDLKKESQALSKEDEEILKAASKLLQEDKVPEEFWQDIASRCIACTACNLACPTCTCFEVYDWQRGDVTERNRMWDSCQLDGFMRETSGHNPMGEEHLRTRRRIHHKLAADVARWSTISCFLCGRCDEVCPVGIGMKSVTREMVERCGK